MLSFKELHHVYFAMSWILYFGVINFIRGNEIKERNKNPNLIIFNIIFKRVVKKINRIERKQIANKKEIKK